MTEKVTFTNSRGQSVVLTNQRPFLLESVDGKGDVDADIQTQKSPFQDGSTPIDILLNERNLSMKISIIGEDRDSLLTLRQFIASVFNPKLGLGTLVYENGNTKREIQAISESIPIFPTGKDNKGLRFQRSLINLLCPNPYWLSEKVVSQLVVWEGGLTFPLKLPNQFARQSKSKEKILVNEGEVEVPLEIVFNGPATSPIRIINVTTGKYIEVNQSLLEGERLEINTAFGQKRVTKVLVDGTRKNAFHFITLGSSFFQLTYGNNLIDYSTGADYERAGVEIMWKNRYSSV